MALLVHGIWEVPGDLRDGSPIFFGRVQILKIPVVPLNARILPLGQGKPFQMPEDPSLELNCYSYLVNAGQKVPAEKSKQARIEGGIAKQSLKLNK